MYRNRQLNLNGVFSYNQLIVNGVDVAPTIENNSTDISYIYNDGLLTQSNDTLNNATNTKSLSALTETNSQLITNLQTALNNQITQETNDIQNVTNSLNALILTFNNFKSSSNQKITNLQNQINQINTILQQSKS